MRAAVLILAIMLAGCQIALPAGITAATLISGAGAAVAIGNFDLSAEKTICGAGPLIDGCGVQTPTPGGAVKP